MKKKRLRTAADIAMTLLLLLLMAYSLIGETLHEAIGTAIFVLFIVHHIMNRSWYRALPKGRYSALRIFQVVLDALLLLTMIAQPVSGILMSKHLYTFLPVSGAAAAAREIHLLLAYWGLALMSVHAGTHLLPMAKRIKSRAVRGAALLIAAAVSVYGAAAFFARQLPAYMLHRTLFAFFDFDEPLLRFFADYAAIMVLFACMGLLLHVGLRPRKQH